MKKKSTRRTLVTSFDAVTLDSLHAFCDEEGILQSSRRSIGFCS